jgi:uncharacterized protein YndB with AHSA1/START domain
VKDSSETSPPSRMPGHPLTLDRVLDAPRQNVWRCLTEPELLEKWFCPKPWRVTDARLDVRPGGRCDMVMRGPAGEEMPNSGVYLEVVPGQRLLSTDAFTVGWIPSGKAFMVGEWLLEDAPGGKTRYIARAYHWNQEDRDSHEKMWFQEGWGAAAVQLEALARSIEISSGR